MIDIIPLITNPDFNDKLFFLSIEIFLNKLFYSAVIITGGCFNERHYTDFNWVDTYCCGYLADIF